MEHEITESSDTEQSFVINKIIEYNRENVPFTQKEDFIYLNYAIKDDEGNIIAGINSGLYCWNCLCIDVLWVDEQYRKQGLGSQLLKNVETEAKNKGCYIIHLDSFDWQAKDFYLKHGYKIFGELENNPKNYKRYFFVKYI